MQEIDDILAAEFDNSPQSGDALPHISQRQVAFVPGSVNLLSERAQRLVNRSLAPAAIASSLPQVPIHAPLDKGQQKAYRLLAEAAELMKTPRYETYEKALGKYKDFMSTPAHVDIPHSEMLKVQAEAARLEAWLRVQREKESRMPLDCQTASPADCRNCRNPRNKNRTVCKVATPVVCSACDKLRKGIISLDEYRQIMAGDAMHTRYARGVGKLRTKRRRCKKKPTRKRKKKRSRKPRRIRRRSRRR